MNDCESDCDDEDQPVNNPVIITPKQVVGGQPIPKFKSPSDTTIYSPGLCKVSSEEVSLISNFVESIWIDTRRDDRGKNSRDPGICNSANTSKKTGTSRCRSRSPACNMRRVEPSSSSRSDRSGS